MKVSAVAAGVMASGVAAFVQPTAFAGSKLAAVASGSTMQMAAAEMSKSIPFIQRPPALTGEMPGDVGFDPLGMSENLNLGYMQAAELKHCRVAMLAVVGVLVTQFIHLPADQFSATSPLDAIAKVPLAGHLQIFGLIAGLEMGSLNRTYDDSTDAWGKLIQDPSGAKQFAAKSAADKAKSQLQEIKNGRLAMIAIMGMLIQTALFGHPLP
ncbi:light harvesting complex protein [Tribonema minus]|uniref:Light harvesting complex protein n=1 Tax=Tribonema minus TaxID=303371 RepID=A0A835YIY2_9STRA|nr:light harvesting complex protein [Tribonema minus]